MIFFAPHTENTPQCTAHFDAMDGDACLGTCKLRIEGDKADVFSITLTGGDAEIGEGLLRAAYNYAANKGAYWGVCSAENAGEITARLRFETEDGVPQGDIPTLLTGFCDRHSAQNGGQL